MTWVAETLYDGWRQSFEITAELARERSQFQEIAIYQTVSHGRVMVLDGVLQITEADEFAYQEMITHVPLLQHGAGFDILIIGAGDGGVLRRVLQHARVKRAVLVEIDEAVIRLSKQWLPSIGGSAWSDSRASIQIGDGVVYLDESSDATFDIIIVDSTDPAGPGVRLFTQDFYRDCARVMRPGGLLVNQCGVPFMQGSELKSSTALRHNVFTSTTAFVVAAPTYIGGFMAIGLSSNHSIALPSCETLERRADEAGLRGLTNYWTPEVHRASFALPTYIARCLER